MSNSNFKYLKNNSDNGRNNGIPFYNRSDGRDGQMRKFRYLFFFFFFLLQSLKSF